MRLYELGDGRRLVVPATLARTVEIERARIVIEQRDGGGVQASIVEPPSEQQKAPGRRRSLSEDALYDELRELDNGVANVETAKTLLREVKAPIEVFWASSGFTLKMPDPTGETSTLLSLGVVTATGIVYAFHPWLDSQLTTLSVPTETVQQLVSTQRRLFIDFGGKAPKSAKADVAQDQTNIALATLRGRELAFLDALAGFAARVREAILAAR